MSAARKTLKILALIYFVLGIASLVIGIAGIATGNLEIHLRIERHARRGCA